MSAPCDPNALAQAARCFRCLPASTLQEIKTFLFCFLKLGNVMPDDAQYDALGHYELDGLTQDGLYLVIFGPNELRVANTGPDVLFATGQIVAKHFAPMGGSLFFVSASHNVPVTATVYPL